MSSKRVLAFGYYGGKYSKLPFILPQLVTPHHTFVELCCGSAAVLLNKKGSSDREIINDLAIEVVSFFRVLRDNSAELIQAIMDTPAGGAEFRRVIRLMPSDDEVEMARRFYVRVQQAFSNSPNGYYSFVRADSLKSARRSLKQVADRLRDVTAENVGAVCLIERLIATERSSKKPNTILFYVDPPYTDESRQGKGQYIEDDFDHEELLKVITTAPSFCKFAVSGYASELYDERLAKWHRAERDVNVTAGKLKGQKTNKEVLWRNYAVSMQPELLP